MSTYLEEKNESQEVASEAPSTPPPQERREEPLPIPVGDQIEAARQALGAEQAKKDDGYLWTSYGAPETVSGDCSAAKLTRIQKAQELVNAVEGTTTETPSALCPPGGVSFKDRKDTAQVQGFLKGENDLALTPRFFETHWTPCDRATVLHGLALCRESDDCEAFEFPGTSFFPGGEVGQSAADFTRCESQTLHRRKVETVTGGDDMEETVETVKGGDDLE